MYSLETPWVLTSRERRAIEGLRLNPRKSFAGRIRGERLTRKKGISIEFADYREYTDGDDLRHLDWNVLARLQTPVIKTYQDEEDLAVLLMLDQSASMSFGQPQKSEMAVKLACAMGYVGLCGLDAVRGYALGKREPPSRYLRGSSAYRQLAEWASRPKGQEFGTQAVSQGLKAIAGSHERIGLAIIVSDGLDPDIQSALRVLGGRGYEIMFLQVLADLDLDPDIEGDLRLLDSESEQKVEITANSPTLRTYKENMEQHCKAIEAECLRYGGRYERMISNESVEACVQRLRRAGWLVS